MNVVLPRPQVGSGVELFTSAITVPYAAGMAANPLALIDDTFTVVGPRREPALLVRLKRALADESVVVKLTVGTDEQPPVVFAPFSAEGTQLPGFVPKLPPGEDGTGTFSATVELHIITGDGRNAARPTITNDALSNEEAADLIEGVVLEGRLARLLYLGTLEKQRCIRVAREINAMRYLTLNQQCGLDDRGRDLGVPRLTSIDETDEQYRARLAIYNKWRLGSPDGFADALNGPGADTDPNQGLPSLIGVNERFRIVERINDLSIATKLVSVGPDGTAELEKFHDILKAQRLVDLQTPTPKTMPEQRRAQYESIRETLNNELTRTPSPTNRYLAPLNALTLDRTVRLLRFLGHDNKIILKRSYDPDGGSRYELGLGVDIQPLTQNQLEKLAESVGNVNAENAIGDIGLLARSLMPRSAKDDPLGRWIFEPCGFRTVHLLDADTLHLAPLPTQGQWIDGPSKLSISAQQITYEARYHASGASTGIHERAQAALNATKAAFEADGLGEVPPHLPPSKLNDALQALTDAANQPALPQTLQSSADAGLITIDAKTYARQLTSVFNLDQIVGFTLSKSALDGIGTENKLRDGLIKRIDSLQKAGFYSARGIWDATNNQLLLLASVSQLPGATFKIGEPPPATFYWYETRLPRPIMGMDDPLQFMQRRGGKATVRTGRMGLALLVCIGYARRGFADPFEIRIELPDEALLNMDQYGYLMNLLEAIYPIGIEINTFQIRRNHVDADGDGEPEFLTSRASRTYFKYQHRRAFNSGRGREQRGENQ